jgi:hypothetical protein
MATDPKLVAQMLDLSRNVEKLTGELRKNTSVTGDLVKAQENTEDSKTAEKPQNTSDKKILDSLKGLDFNIIKETLGDLNDSIKKIDKIDFKNLGDTIKAIDPKKITESFKSIGDMKDIGKNLISGGTDVFSKESIKNIVGGSLPKIGGDLFGKGGIGSILGGFAKGGTVNIPGNYVVGEMGPEILKLNTGDRVVPNEDINSFITGKIPDLQEKRTPKNEISENKPEKAENKKMPTGFAEEIAKLMSDYKNEEEGEENYETFTREDIKKLSTPVNKDLINNSVDKKETPISNIEGNLSKESLNIVKKENLKEKESGKKGGIGDIFNSDLISKGSSLIKNLPIDKNTSSSDISNILKNPSDLIKKIDAGKIGSSLKSIGGINLPGLSEKKETKQNNPMLEFKKNVPILKDQPLPKFSREQTNTSSDSTVKSNVEQSMTKNSMDSAGQSQPIQEQSVSTPTQKTESSNSGSSQSSINSKDLEEIKSLLARMAASLSGTLIVSPMESPYRPDSRRV